MDFRSDAATLFMKFDEGRKASKTDTTVETKEMEIAVDVMMIAADFSSLGPAGVKDFKYLRKSVDSREIPI